MMFLLALSGALTVTTVSAEDRSGPDRQALCRVDGGASTACIFTPLFGDGSFSVALPNRELRMVVDGDDAVPFEAFGPTHRVPLSVSYRRDPNDKSCWNVVDGPGRLCVARK